MSKNDGLLIGAIAVLGFLMIPKETKEQILPGSGGGSMSLNLSELLGGLSLGGATPAGGFGGGGLGGLNEALTGGLGGFNEALEGGMGSITDMLKYGTEGLVAITDSGVGLIEDVTHAGIDIITNTTETGLEALDAWSDAFLAKFNTSGEGEGGGIPDNPLNPNQAGGLFPEANIEGLRNKAGIVGGTVTGGATAYFTRVLPQAGGKFLLNILGRLAPGLAAKAGARAVSYAIPYAGQAYLAADIGATVYELIAGKNIAGGWLGWGEYIVPENTPVRNKSPEGSQASAAAAAHAQEGALTHLPPNLAETEAASGQPEQPVAVKGEQITEAQITEMLGLGALG